MCAYKKKGVRMLEECLKQRYRNAQQKVISTSTRICGLLRGGFKRFIAEEAGQGTTEYAILVGVLVVIAIIAVLAFKDKIQEMWTAISDGINSL